MVTVLLFCGFEFRSRMQNPFCRNVRALESHMVTDRELNSRTFTALNLQKS